MKTMIQAFKAAALALSLAGSHLHPTAQAAETANGPEPKQADVLPLKEIILYSSGTGFFWRAGQIEGNESIELRFKTEEINDLLKSLVVEDRGGGQVTTVTYGSRDPVEKALKSFGIDLTSNPTLGDLLNQIRGERVEVVWPPSRLVGVIVGVQTKRERVDEEVVEREFLNLLTQEGLQSVPLDQAQRIQLLSARLNQELRQALEVLAASHDTQKKTVTINFEGEGSRTASISYIMQTPVWKTSYRLLLGDDETPEPSDDLSAKDTQESDAFLQGWAIVENTSDQDWNEVDLSLVSGRPISFTMDLYEPLYAPRPEVELELYTSLRPQVYRDAMQTERVLEESEARLERSVNRFGIAPQAAAPSRAAGAAAKSEMGALFAGDGIRRGRGVQLDFGTVAAAEGRETGELFQYSISHPVSLPRQQSAMLPIVNEKVSGQKLSIYNERVQARHPLNGFRLQNSTSLYLMQGPITIFADGAYAGDAQIQDLPPGQDRLLSYALDVEVEVDPQSGAGEQELVSVQIVKGTVMTRRQAVREKTYHIRNKDQKSRRLLVEHPFESDWELVQPSEAHERTREVYRFLVDLPAESSEKLLVREQKQYSEQIQLTNLGYETISLYLRSNQISSAVKKVLRHVVELRSRIDETAGERQRKEQRVQEIAQEQARIRENMTRLSPNSELHGRYIQKLNQQETEIEELRGQIRSLSDEEAELKRELNDYLIRVSAE